MGNIIPEPYTDDKKSYLTYNPHAIAKSRLLYETTTHRFEVYKGGQMVYSKNQMSNKVMDSLKENGFVIKVIDRTSYWGRTTFDLQNGKKIPIIVRKIMESGVLKQIRVRITAKTHEELMENTYAIRDTLAAYGLKHKLCIWDRSGSL